MTVAVIALAGLAVSLTGLQAWLVYKVIKKGEEQVADAHQDADTRVAQVELERVNAELKSQYEAARRHAAGLKESLRDALSKPSGGVGDGLAADDVAGRRLRLFERWEDEADATDGGDPDAAVPGRDEEVAGGGPATTPT